MPRVISFIVLTGVMLLIAAMFFQVMLSFVVPLFLAAVLVVVFEPLHRAIGRRFPTQPRLTALATTILILIVVLAPIVGLGFAAYFESVDYVEQLIDENKFSKFEQELENRFQRALIWYQNLFGQPLDVGELVKAAAQNFGPWAGTAGWTGLKVFLATVIGLLIMIISLYYFLADGPSMIDGLMQLSPLDDKYERELLEKFSEISRTVVVAMLLSAVAQGTLAGIGYFFALGTEAPIFLLTALTMLLSIVPFVGAAGVWIPASLWLALTPSPTDPETTQWKAALFLALYGALIVSTVDNLIKPWVLHGQSRLHPLLALLSILGGIQVMGPIGILVGPMLVIFLQTLLKMVRKELDHFREESDLEPDRILGESKPEVPLQSPPASTSAPKTPPSKKKRK